MPNKYLNQEAFQELVSVIKERVIKSDQESLSDLQAQQRFIRQKIWRDTMPMKQRSFMFVFLIVCVTLITS